MAMIFSEFQAFRGIASRFFFEISDRNGARWDHAPIFLKGTRRARSGSSRGRGVARGRAQASSSGVAARNRPRVVFPGNCDEGTRQIMSVSMALFPFAAALVFCAGFPSRVGLLWYDKFFSKIDRVRDTIIDKRKLLGFPVPQVPFPGVPGAGVRRGHKEVMPPWPKEVGSQT